MSRLFTVNRERDKTVTEVTGRSLVGRTVVSVATGEKLGEISDVHLDFDARRVVGFAIGGGGGLFRHEPPQALPFAQVQSIGPQAVTVADNAQVLAAQVVPTNLAGLERVRKRVVSAGGEVVGDGDDIHFDTATGAITAVQLAPQGGFLGVGATTRMIPVADVIGFGRDVLTVRESAETEII